MLMSAIAYNLKKLMRFLYRKRISSCMQIEKQWTVTIFCLHMLWRATAEKYFFRFHYAP